MSPVELVRTPRLHFRRLSVEEHARPLFEMENDPEVMRYINDCPDVPWAGYEDRIRDLVARVYAKGEQLAFWTAHENDDGAFLGWFHLRPNPRFEDRIELGYRLRRSAWGRGIATEGSRALIDYGFQLAGVPEVMAVTLERNAPSRRVMEKLGMTLEAHFDFPAEVLPFWNEEQRRSVRYSLARPAA